MKKAVILIALYLIIFFSINNSFAHKVNIYAYIDGDMIHAESYFADGSKCKNCTIEVYDKNTDRMLLEGKTDDNGRFAFKKPEAVSLRLVLKAGIGHQAQYNLVLKGALIKEKTQDIKIIKDGISKEVQDKANLDKQKCLSSEEIEAIVTRAIEKELQPLINQIALMHQEIGRVGTIEVIGGIGYILGIMGLVLYFKSRKKIDK